MGAFRLFTREDAARHSHKAGGAKPMVTINRFGQMAINAAAVHAFHLEDWTHILVYCDHNGKRIAIARVVPDKRDHALTLSKSVKGAASRKMSVRCVLAEIGVSLDQSMRYEPTLNEETGMIVIDLKAGTPVKAKQ